MCGSFAFHSLREAMLVVFELPPDPPNDPPKNEGPDRVEPDGQRD